MKSHYSFFLICGFAIFSVSTGCGGPTRFCDDETARLVSRAYILSFPWLGQDKLLEQLINDNRSAFNENGGATRCMRSLGTALLQQSIQRRPANPYAAQERFAGMMPPGLGHLPGQVDAEMRNAGTEFLTMGQELTWLAQVLPAASQGNAGPYNSQATPWRQMMNSLVPQLNLLCSMDPSVCQSVLTHMKSLLPVAEQQVYVLATGKN
jgi:hypothetical protein